MMKNTEALESVMCDVIKRIATRSGKGNQPLNIKTAVEWPILELNLTNFRWRFYFTLLLVASLLFRCIFMTSHLTLSALQNYFLYFDILVSFILISFLICILIYLKLLRKQKSNLYLVQFVLYF